MNQKQAKKLRLLARHAVLRAPLFVTPTEYQYGTYGELRLRPTCQRAIYHLLKRRFKKMVSR